MPNDRTRRELLKTATGVAIGATAFAGAANAAGLTSGSDSATGPAQQVPFAVVTAEKSVFAPELLVIPAGATVEFRGNRYPHTITSTDSLVDPLTDCSNAYNGEGDLDEYDGTRLGDVEYEHTVESPDEPYNVRLASGGLTYITYEETGEYPYYCVPHCGSKMVGKIQVVEEPV